MILLFIIILLTVIGTLGQQIVLNDPQYITPCVTDLRDGKDKYNITGTVGPNIDSLTTIGNWSLSVSLQVLKNNSLQFEDICSMVLGINGSFCRPSTEQHCNCDHLDSNGIAHVIAIVPASVSHSQGIIRGEWKNFNGSLLHSDTNITLPNIFDVNKAKLELTVNPPSKKSDSCISLQASVNNQIELCCTETATPCYPRLSFSDGIVIENMSSCVYRTINPNDTVTITTSYSVCNLSDYINSVSCKTDPPDDADIKIIVLPVAIVLGPGIGVGIGTVMCCCKKKRKRQQLEETEPEEKQNNHIEFKKTEAGQNGKPHTKEVNLNKSHDNKVIFDNTPPASKNGIHNLSESQAINTQRNETDKVIKVNGASNNVKSDKSVRPLPKLRVM